MTEFDGPTPFKTTLCEEFVVVNISPVFGWFPVAKIPTIRPSLAMLPSRFPSEFRNVPSTDIRPEMAAEATIFPVTPVPEKN
jgi:hypothetical protein